ncbi:hypothetical protein PAAG_00725 [Paracoccidioides lutzii Pb01]|uniref:Uncharacterized protein n=1 Tax=Paracoccidioides lutzii (strain ATCC MYA-826 / Pb01) TaxID=502779 RepID=C1GQD0_PARBA|nr:hypothetical protein PAAG_00725 [Paracoccidioides lutzii Pb01]EEH37804.2 hypothetical protein PAAG_00725 [Paracoccidioides lutzii Pb01]
MASNRPSDRPDRPPVWVRGGPPYYYMPTRPHIPSSPSETLRRGSTSSTLSSSPGSTMGETLSPPPSPSTRTTQAPRSSSVGIPTSFPFPSPSHPISSPYPSPPPATSAAGDEATSPPRADSFRRSNSVSGTNISFSTLSLQKRNAGDGSTSSLRAQWHEQNVGAGPDRRKIFSSWWNSYVKGSRPSDE